MAYIVVLKDGPADGLKTVACHTRAVYFGGHRYALNDQGDFVYAPMRESVPSITCPRCGRTTYNPNDIRERYCGHCHAWHEGMQ